MEFQESNYFVTSKLWNDDIRKGRELEAFRESLKKLGTEYLEIDIRIDLIHWPVEGFMKSWHILEDLYRNGAVRAIGVSNFHKQHLEMLEAEAEIMPMVNQFECQPLFVPGDADRDQPQIWNGL